MRLPRSWFPGWLCPLPESPGGVDAQEAGGGGLEFQQHQHVLGSGPVHRTDLFRAQKVSKKSDLPKNTVKVSISTTGTVIMCLGYHLLQV